MKFTVAAAIAAGFVACAALPAAAEDINIAKVTCKEFISSKQDDIGVILAWLEGFYSKRNDPVFHIDKMQKDAEALGAYCQKNGEDGLIKAADAVMK